MSRTKDPFLCTFCKFINRGITAYWEMVTSIPRKLMYCFCPTDDDPLSGTEDALEMTERSYTEIPGNSVNKTESSYKSVATIGTQVSYQSTTCEDILSTDTHDTPQTFGDVPPNHTSKRCETKINGVNEHKQTEKGRDVKRNKIDDVYQNRTSHVNDIPTKKKCRHHSMHKIHSREKTSQSTRFSDDSAKSIDEGYAEHHVGEYKPRSRRKCPHHDINANCSHTTNQSTTGSSDHPRYHADGEFPKNENKNVNEVKIRKRCRHHDNKTNSLHVTYHCLKHYNVNKLQETSDKYESTHYGGKRTRKICPHHGLRTNSALLMLQSLRRRYGYVLTEDCENRERTQSESDASLEISPRTKKKVTFDLSTTNMHYNAKLEEIRMMNFKRRRPPDTIGFQEDLTEISFSSSDEDNAAVDDTKEDQLSLDEGNSLKALQRESSPCNDLSGNKLNPLFADDEIEDDFIYFE